MWILGGGIGNGKGEGRGYCDDDDEAMNRA